MMEEKLQKMDPQKRQNLIRAAIDEFASHPFQQASTNNIVKKAGISKGLLFHYFNDKKELYDTTIRFAVEMLFTKMSSCIHWEERDLLERLRQIVVEKIKIWQEYPNMFDCIFRVLQNENHHTSLTFYRELGVDLSTLIHDIYRKNIDLSLFKDQSNIEKSLEIIQWTLDGLSQKYTKVYQSQQTETSLLEISKEVQTYIDMLKHILYKQEKEEAL